jgi:hypothetical protein
MEKLVKDGGVNASLIRFPRAEKPFLDGDLLM